MDSVFKIVRLYLAVAWVVLGVGLGSTDPAFGDSMSLERVLEAGLSTMEVGRFGDAANYYRSFLAHFPHSLELYRHFVQASVGVDRGEDARRLFESVIAPGYDGPLAPAAARYGLSLLALLNGNRQEARRTLAPLLAQPNPPSHVLLLDAYILTHEEHFSDAADRVRQAMGEETTNEWAQRVLALLDALAFLQNVDVAALSDRPDNELGEQFTARLLAILVSLLTDAEAVNGAVIPKLEKVKEHLLADCKCKTVVELVLAMAEMRIYGRNRLSEINGWIWQIVADGTMSARDVSARDGRIYAALLAYVAELNRQQGQYETAYEQMSAFDALTSRLDLDPGARLYSQRTLEYLAALLNRPAERLVHQARIVELVRSMTKRNRSEFLAPVPAGLLIGAPLAGVMALLGAFVATMRGLGRSLRPDAVPAALRSRLRQWVAKAHVSVMLPWIARAALALGVVAAAGCGGLYLAQQPLPRLYRAAYPYTAVDAGLAAAALIVGLAGAVALLAARKPLPSTVAALYDRAMATGGAFEANLCFGFRHTAKDDLLHHQVRRSLERPVPPGVVPLLRPSLAGAAAVGALGAAISLYAILPPPPPEAANPGLRMRAPIMLTKNMASPRPASTLERPAPGKVGLDMNTSLVSHLPESDSMSVAGLDNKGTPTDYLTAVPGGQWDYQRRDRTAKGNRGAESGRKSQVWIETSRQRVPPHYRWE